MYHIIYLNWYLDLALLANSEVSYLLVPEELKEPESTTQQRKNYKNSTSAFWESKTFK